MNKNKINIFLIVIFLLFVSLNIFSLEKDTYLCGLATGYPPYQYVNEKGETSGIDADVVRLIFDKLKKKVVFQQQSWDDVVAILRFSDKIDCIGGMEVSDVRKEHFDFTISYYERNIALFILETNTSIKEVKDLAGLVITGDRQSFVERKLEAEGLKDKIRIKQTQSKEDSFKLLKTGEVVGVIAPKAVGLYLAKKMGIKVRFLQDPDPGSPVAIAVKKGNTELLNKINKALQELIKEGKIESLKKKWLE
ncbi:MAG: hypothetical protein A2086_01365 [Spirochaetes bacterium GWD1_27_9]|nr:MAG: hypothetical protein A2Z98_13310 [Spirochaetes bacterium GWB1_27_13]OHD36924.1 MAG: hypothetical protein A2086_01365 [Spirochaetes bacterium GWD1_27_9]